MGLRRPVMLVALLLILASAGIYTPITIPEYTHPHTKPVFGCGDSCGTTDWFASTPFNHGAIPFAIGDADGYDIVAAGHDADKDVRIPPAPDTILKKATHIHFLLTGALSDCEQKTLLTLQYEGGTSADVELEVPDKSSGCENIAIFFGQALDWFVYVRSVKNPEPDKNIIALEFIDELEGFGPRLILIAITFEHGEADENKENCEAMVGEGHWGVDASERVGKYIYLYYGNKDAESTSDLAAVSEAVLVNPGFETTDTCLEADPEGWTQYASSASNDCWEVETVRVKGGSKAFGNSYGCNEVCDDNDESADVWPNMYVRQDLALPASGQYRVKAGYWFTGITYDGSGCAEHALGEDDSRPHLFALDSNGGQLAEHKGPSFSDLGKELSMGTWAYQDVEWTTPANTKTLRFQVDGLDGNNLCRSSDAYDGGNAGGYIDDARVFVRKLPDEEPRVLLGGTDDASWWHEDWTQRLSIGIVSDDALEEYQAKVVIDTASIIKAGHMQYNCSDIRFVSDKGQVLPHWIEPGWYLFNWTRIPPDDTWRLKAYLKDTLHLDWIDAAEVKKADDGRAVKISLGANEINITLSDGNYKAVLSTSTGVVQELIVKEVDGYYMFYAECYSRETVVWVRVPTIPEADRVDAICCGDDGGEHRIARRCQSGCESDPDEVACCDDPNDCVFDECVLYGDEDECKNKEGCTWNADKCDGLPRCYGISDERDLKGDDTQEYCDWGVWKERFEVMYEPGSITKPHAIVQHIERGGGSIYLKVRNQFGFDKNITNMNFSVSGMLQDMNPTFFTSEPDRVWNERTNTLREFVYLASITVTLRYDIPSFDDLLVNQFKGGIVILADDLPPVYIPVTIYVDYTNVVIDDLNRKDIHALMSFSMGSIKISGGYRTKGK